MTMAFYVGQKVVRISGPETSPDGSIMPKIGSIYTIRSIEDRSAGEPVWKAGLAVTLAEIVSAIHPATGKEYAFLSTNFRPVVEKKTDISIFTEMLHQTPVPVDAETLRAFDRAMAEAYPSRQPDYIERHRK
jgi:hypothetical protein